MSLPGFRNFYLFSDFYYKARHREKWAAMQVATMLADHKQIDKKKQLGGTKTEAPPWDGQQ